MLMWRYYSLHDRLAPLGRTPNACIMVGSYTHSSAIRSTGMAAIPANTEPLFGPITDADAGSELSKAGESRPASRHCPSYVWNRTVWAPNWQRFYQQSKQPERVIACLRQVLARPPEVERRRIACWQRAG